MNADFGFRKYKMIFREPNSLNTFKLVDLQQKIFLPIFMFNDVEILIVVEEFIGTSAIFAKWAGYDS